MQKLLSPTYSQIHRASGFVRAIFFGAIHLTMFCSSVFHTIEWKSRGNLDRGVKENSGTHLSGNSLADVNDK